MGAMKDRWADYKFLKGKSSGHKVFITEEKMKDLGVLPVSSGFLPYGHAAYCGFIPAVREWLLSHGPNRCYTLNTGYRHDKELGYGVELFFAREESAVLFKLTFL